MVPSAKVKDNGARGGGVEASRASLTKKKEKSGGAGVLGGEMRIKKSAV